MTDLDKKILEDGNVYTLRRLNVDKWAKVKMYNYAFDDIGPCTNALGLPATGLTEDTNTTDEKGRKTIEKGSRSIVEKMLGLDEGTLRAGTLHKPSEYWLRFAIRVNDKDVKFNTSIPEHALNVLYLKAQSQVAFGLNSITPHSEYVLFTEEEEAKVENKKAKGRRSAYVMFDKLTPSERRDILEISGTKTDTLTDEVVERKLGDFMEDYPAKFISMVEDPTRGQKTFIRTCMDKGLISFDESGETIVYGETVLGYDLNSAANALFSKDNTSVLEALKMQLK